MSARRKAVPRLARVHLADLRRSGLTEETIAAAGIRSLSRVEVKAALGMNAGSGYSIPYRGATHRDGTPYVRVRLDNAFLTSDGHRARYLSRKGEPPRLYIPPGLPEGWRENANVKLLIAEGEKKALAASQAGFWCLGIAGVWAWLVRNADVSRPLPDFDRIVWCGRRVVLVGDSDLRTNAQAAAGLEGLRRELTMRGARASVLLLPEEREGR